MRRIIFLSATLVLLFAFSTLMFAQQTTPSAHKPMKTQQAQTQAQPRAEQQMSHASHPTKLNKTEIIALQDALAKAGYYKEKSTGTFGPKTRKALAEYQKANHLKVTGKPDEETLNKLGLAHTAPAMHKKAELEKKEMNKPVEKKTESKPIHK
ncbi:MAG: peptidoglycan-binding protein [candidate division KSB1 bacterium]|nr:peptidoglycan-binding protein [candidate division KSB1 bacterium]